jgi:hypothetical protein
LWIITMFKLEAIPLSLKQAKSKTRVA